MGIMNNTILLCALVFLVLAIVFLIGKKNLQKFGVKSEHLNEIRKSCKKDKTTINNLSLVEKKFEKNNKSIYFLRINRCFSERPIINNYLKQSLLDELKKVKDETGYDIYHFVDLNIEEGTKDECCNKKTCEDEMLCNMKYIVTLKIYLKKDYFEGFPHNIGIGPKSLDVPLLYQNSNSFNTNKKSSNKVLLDKRITNILNNFDWYDKETKEEHREANFCNEYFKLSYMTDCGHPYSKNRNDYYDLDALKCENTKGKKLCQYKKDKTNSLEIPFVMSICKIINKSIIDGTPYNKSDNVNNNNRKITDLDFGVNGIKYIKEQIKDNLKCDSMFLTNKDKMTIKIKNYGLEPGKLYFKLARMDIPSNLEMENPNIIPTLDFNYEGYKLKFNSDNGINIYQKDLQGSHDHLTAIIDIYNYLEEPPLDINKSLKKLKDIIIWFEDKKISIVIKENDKFASILKNINIIINLLLEEKDKKIIMIKYGKSINRGYPNNSLLKMMEYIKQKKNILSKVISKRKLVLGKIDKFSNIWNMILKSLILPNIKIKITIQNTNTIMV